MIKQKKQLFRRRGMPFLMALTLLVTGLSVQAENISSEENTAEVSTEDYSQFDFEGAGFEKTEQKCQTEWNVTEGDVFSLPLEELFGKYVCYRKEQSVNTNDWKWVILKDKAGNGSFSGDGTDSFKDGCLIYLGRYDITAIDSFVLNMGLNSNPVSVELLADCELSADPSEWTELEWDTGKENDTIIYASDALNQVTGGISLGTMTVAAPASSWNGVDYEQGCSFEEPIIGEHDLYLNVTKEHTGTWLGNLKAFRFSQEYLADFIDGSAVENIQVETEVDNIQIDDGVFKWDTSNKDPGVYPFTFSGQINGAETLVTLNITVKEKKAVIPAETQVTNYYQEKEDGYQYSVPAGETIEINTEEVLGKLIGKSTQTDTSPKNWEWAVISQEKDFSVNNSYMAGKVGYTLYLGEYDITDLESVTLQLAAPSSVKLDILSLMADCELRSDPAEWTRADVTVSEDSNDTTCYLDDGQISGGMVLCSVGDLEATSDGIFTGSSSDWNDIREYTVFPDTELEGKHKIYLTVHSSTAGWTGNLYGVTLRTRTEIATETAFDPSLVYMDELPQGASITAEGILRWETAESQGGVNSLTLKTIQNSYCPEKKIQVEVIDYPILSIPEEITFYLEQENQLKVDAYNPVQGMGVTYTLTGFPLGMSICTEAEGEDGIITWTPEEGQEGSYTIGIQAEGKTLSPVYYTTVHVKKLTEDIATKNEAEQILDSAVTGYRPGEYSFYAKDWLRSTLDELDDDDATGICAAVNQFRSMVNKESDGDVNGDGVINLEDLNLVTEEYGKETSEYDVDGNSKISLEDMVHIAKRLESEIYRTQTVGADAAMYVTQSGSWQHYVNDLDTGENAMVHFSLSDLPGDIVSAKLMLNVMETTDENSSVTAAFVEDDKVVQMKDSENREGLSLPLVSKYSASAVVKGGCLEMDVTGMAKQEAAGDGQLTLYMNSADGVVFYSEDGGDLSTMPRLEITFAVDEETAASMDSIEKDFAALELSWPDKVYEDQNFASEGADGTIFQWTSEDEYVITDEGVITRPVATLEDDHTFVTVKASNGLVTVEKRLAVTVAKQDMSAYTTPNEAQPAIEEVELEEEVTDLVEKYWMDEEDTFEYVNYPEQYLDGNTVMVAPGESIQDAVDAVSHAGGGVVILGEGIHLLHDPVTMQSNVTLVGYGKERTIIRQAEDLQNSFFKDNGGCVENFVFKDLSIEGMRGYAYNPSGILMNGSGDKWHNRIMMQNIRLKNCACMGIHLKRVDDVIMDNCEVVYNGESSGFYHNIYFLYNNRILQSDLDLSRPVLGKGCKYTATVGTIAQRVFMKDGTGNGIQADHTADYLLLHKYEIKDFAGVALWFPCENFNDKYTYTESTKYSQQNAILSRCTITGCKNGGIWRVVENPHILNCYFENREHDLELLKCGKVDVSGTIFAGPDGKAVEYDRADLDGYYLTEDNEYGE